MTNQMRFDQDLPMLLDDLYITGTPDYRDDLVRRIAATRQRPAWMFPERWLPVDITTQAAPAARMPWRQLGVLALIGVLIALMAVAYVGSQQDEPAPLFGVAANGQIALARDGDIVAVDHETDAVSPLVIGPEVDSEPAFSLDGTQIGFLRDSDGAGGPDLVMVGSADGSGIARINSEPLASLMQWSFSPDGRDVLVLAWADGLPRLIILPVDGSRAPRILDVAGLPTDVGSIEAVGYRPPDGSEILVMTEPTTGSNRAIEAVDVETGQARTIVPASSSDIFGASWSPTGEYVTYQRYEPLGGIRAHIVGADGMGDRLLDPTSDVQADFAHAWSNDGGRIVTRSREGEGADGFAVVTVDASQPPIVVQCGPNGGDACPDDLTWSPDDSTLVGHVTFNEAVVGYVRVDPATGRMTDVPWTGDSSLSWQRRAP
jgi:dipeptidyl aminopeptidase/acylaminoacyl peptidase